MQADLEARGDTNGPELGECSSEFLFSSLYLPPLLKWWLGTRCIVVVPTRLTHTMVGMRASYILRAFFSKLR